MNSLTPYEQNLIRRLGRDPVQVQQQLDTHPNQPVEYVLGRAEFDGELYHVTPDTLIPRVETEELLDLVSQDWATQSQNLESEEVVKLADIGTGCGAIGIGLARKLATQWPNRHWSLTLSDVSEAATAVARQNAESLLTEFPNVEWQVFSSDLWQEFGDREFDLVTANLPYIPHERLPHLVSSVIDYEPHLALDGGDEGLELVGRFLAQLPSHLTPTGVVWLELDHTHTVPDLKRLNPKLQYQHYRDQFGQPRFVRVVQPLT